MDKAIIAAVYLFGGLALGIISITYGSHWVFRRVDAIAPDLWSDRQGAIVIWLITVALVATFAVLGPRPGDAVMVAVPVRCFSDEICCTVYEDGSVELGGCLPGEAIR
jgi:hypothetical protein